MAEGTKITAARAAAYAALGYAAVFASALVLCLVAFLLSSDGQQDNEEGGPIAWLIVGAFAVALAVAPLLTTWRMSRVQWPNTKPARTRFWSALPSWLVAGCSLILGLMIFGVLIESARGGDSGTLAVAGVIYVLLAWPLVVAMAIAALISCLGVARPFGSNTFLIALLAVVSGLFSFFNLPPLPLLVTIGSLAAFWWAVGMELWRLDAPTIADGEQ